MKRIHVCGVYVIRNLINHKVYIGSSKDIRKRLLEHKRLLKLKKHVNRHLQSAYNLYGESCFEFKIITNCPLHDRIAREQYYMDLFKSYEDTYGYNIESVAGLAGGERSEQTKLKISKANSGRKHEVYSELMIQSHKRLRENPQGVGLINKNKTHCIHGHEFNEENTRYKGHHRICITCVRDLANKSYYKRRKLKPKTHCPNGHEYTEQNVRLGSNKRKCVECYKATQVRKNLKRRKLTIDPSFA